MDKKIINTLDVFFDEYKSLHYKKGEIIIRPDDTPSGVFYVIQGYIKMNSVLENGREITFNIFKPGTFFPTIWAVTNVINTYSFEAITDIEIKRAPKVAFLDFIKKNPEVLFDLTKRVLHGLSGLLTNIQHILTGDSYHRVIAALLLSARRFGTHQDGIQIINIPLTHQDIADIAGITRETASYAISTLKQKKLISYRNHKIVINQPKELEGEIYLSDIQDSASIGL